MCRCAVYLGNVTTIKIAKVVDVMYRKCDVEKVAHPLLVYCKTKAFPTALHFSRSDGGVLHPALVNALI